MKRILCCLVGAALGLASCQNELDVNGGTPDFEVPAVTGTLQAGRPVTFQFAGDAGLISFYSGEPLKQYEKKEGRTEKATGGTLTFTSAVTGGTQANQLSVLASSDFNGNYADPASVQAASWTDITSRFTLGTSASFTSSTAKSISDLMVPGKPLYVAFKYTTKPQADHGAARTWMIQGLTLQSTTAIGTVTAADMFTAGLRLVGTSAARSSATTARVTFLANENSTGSDPASEIWAISAPLPWENVTLGPDRPVGIKGNTGARLESYTYTYTRPGTYKATFVAQNANIDQRKEVVKHVDITITE
ncbi:DUF5017 domain-containing protein [Rhabdobacter roseus]|uniref:DUF5017 domain-containing protein n=1 Tax=Rhabdobacter roseus TaxID=1655419 RepID=A0A840TVU3_9BACT|nr:DUF5017 domain-containing protein [Rhabdobacter roseus]MBB5284268.1 hypothetical protein [Rhabdobacter roseus]